MRSLAIASLLIAATSAPASESPPGPQMLEIEIPIPWPKEQTADLLRSVPLLLFQGAAWLAYEGQHFVNDSKQLTGTDPSILGTYFNVYPKTIMVPAPPPGTRDTDLGDIEVPLMAVIAFLPDAEPGDPPPGRVPVYKRPEIDGVTDAILTTEHGVDIPMQVMDFASLSELEAFDPGGGVLFDWGFEELFDADQYSGTFWTISTTQTVDTLVTPEPASVLLLALATAPVRPGKRRQTRS